MVTGYEERMYSDIHRIAKALEQIAEYLAALTQTVEELKGGGTHGQHQPAPEVSEYGSSGPAGQ
jgi:hypothetical protein